MRRSSYGQEKLFLINQGTLGNQHNNDIWIDQIHTCTHFLIVSWWVCLDPTTSGKRQIITQILEKQKSTNYSLILQKNVTFLFLFTRMSYWHTKPCYWQRAAWSATVALVLLSMRLPVVQVSVSYSACSITTWFLDCHMSLRKVRTWLWCVSQFSATL